MLQGSPSPGGLPPMSDLRSAPIQKNNGPLPSASMRPPVPGTYGRGASFAGQRPMPPTGSMIPRPPPGASMIPRLPGASMAPRPPPGAVKAPGASMAPRPLLPGASMISKTPSGASMMLRGPSASMRPSSSIAPQLLPGASMNPAPGSSMIPRNVSLGGSSIGAPPGYGGMRSMGSMAPPPKAPGASMAPPRPSPAARPLPGASMASPAPLPGASMAPRPLMPSASMAPRPPGPPPSASMAPRPPGASMAPRPPGASMAPRLPGASMAPRPAPLIAGATPQGPPGAPPRPALPGASMAPRPPGASMAPRPPPPGASMAPRPPPPGASLSPRSVASSPGFLRPALSITGDGPFVPRGGGSMVMNPPAPSASGTTFNGAVSRPPPPPGAVARPPPLSRGPSKASGAPSLSKSSARPQQQSDAKEVHAGGEPSSTQQPRDDDTRPSPSATPQPPASPRPQESDEHGLLRTQSSTKLSLRKLPSLLSEAKPRERADVFRKATVGQPSSTPARSPSQRLSGGDVPWKEGGTPPDLFPSPESSSPCGLSPRQASRPAAGAERSQVIRTAPSTAALLDTDVGPLEDPHRKTRGVQTHLVRRTIDVAERILESQQAPELPTEIRHYDERFLSDDTYMIPVPLRTVPLGHPHYLTTRLPLRTPPFALQAAQPKTTRFTTGRMSGPLLSWSSRTPSMYRRSAVDLCLGTVKDYRAEGLEKLYYV